MIRPILTEILLFLTPFAVYVAFLLATRAGVLKVESWSPRVLMVLTIIALSLMIGGFVLLGQQSGQPAGSNYVPPHMENGTLVPGQFK